MKKKQRSRILLGAVAIVLVVAVMIVLLSMGNSGKNYEEYTVKKGDIVRETKLAGQLQTEGSTAITGTSGRIIESVVVEENELVTAGQIIATLDVSEIEERIKEAEDRIETAEARLLSLDAEKTTKVLRASAGGRVKEINKDNFSDEKLILLSLDGRMRVAFESQEELNIGNAKIEVEAGDRKYDGVLYAQKDNAYVVTIDDAELMQGATVTIKANGEVIGTGVAEINVPYWITGELSNIESYAVSVNKSIQKGCELANLKVAVHTEAYDSALKECEEAEAELARMMSVKEDPYIYALESGIIKELGIAEHMMIVGAAKEVVIGSIIPATPSAFVASIPERYINDLGIGAEVDIALSVYPGEIRKGTVKEISPIGDYSNGITTYEVKIGITEREADRIGMSGTVTIETGRVEACLRLPIELLHMKEDGYYVLVCNEEGMAVEKSVKIGMCNDHYAEITEGLAEGEKVLYQGMLTVSEE